MVYTDKSLIRNKLVFDLSNSIGFKASNTKFYNLFINDENGLYILMEKIKRDVNKLIFLNLIKIQIKEDLLSKLINQLVKEQIVTLVTMNHFHLDQIMIQKEIFLMNLKFILYTIIQSQST